jgi:hypothetical protein
MKFSKKDFDKNYKPKEKGVDELYSPDGDFGGDTPHKPHDEVKTDMGKAFDDESDFEKGIDQTSDDFASKTKNTAADFFGWNSGTVTSMGGMAESTKGKLRKMAEEIVKNSNNSTIVDKSNNYSDVNSNNISDIDELGKPVIISKVKGLIKSINSNQVNGEELGIITNYILQNLNLKEIPNNYKNIIKRNI